MGGYVYLVGNPIFGWYKIGKSKTPEVRVKDLGILLPFKLEVISVWAAVDHTLMEQTLHEMYVTNRINGEWFEFSREKVAELCKSIPIESCIFPSVSPLTEKLTSFSNIEKDTRNNKRVIGVRTQKLRGDFTEEERNQKRIDGIKLKRQKKLDRINNNLTSYSTTPSPNGNIIDRLKRTAQKRQQKQNEQNGSVDKTATLLIEAATLIERLRSHDK